MTNITINKEKLEYILTFLAENVSREKLAELNDKLYGEVLEEYCNG